jgi:hypothetical protein
MKESRFIELLNLYVDHQLSAAEAAQLEAEITRDPERRQTYQQYCRIQKACTLLFEHERTSAPASDTLTTSLAEADRKVVEFPRRRASTLRPIYTFGSALAAAACVAFVLTNLNHHDASKNSGDVTTEAEIGERGALAVASQAAPTPEVIQSVAIPAPAMVPAVAKEPRPEFYSVFAAQQSVGYRSTKASDQTEKSDVVVSDDWMQNVKFTPLPSLSDERLAVQPAMSISNDRVLHSRKPFQATTENAAFQFQR